VDGPSESEQDAARALKQVKRTSRHKHVGYMQNKTSEEAEIAKALVVMIYGREMWVRVSAWILGELA
jgi:hypothetical protein